MKKPPDAPPDFLPKPLNLCHIYQFHIVDRLLHLEAVRERVRGVKGGQAGDRKLDRLAPDLHRMARRNPPF